MGQSGRVSPWQVFDEMTERSSQALEFDDLPIDVGQMLGGQSPDIGAHATAIAPQAEECPDLVDEKPGHARYDEAQLVHVPCVVVPIVVCAASACSDQADRLVVPIILAVTRSLPPPDRSASPAFSLLTFPLWEGARSVQVTSHGARHDRPARSSSP